MTSDALFFYLDRFSIKLNEVVRSQYTDQVG